MLNGVDWWIHLRCSPEGEDVLARCPLRCSHSPHTHTITPLLTPSQHSARISIESSASPHIVDEHTHTQHGRL